MSGLLIYEILTKNNKHEKYRHLTKNLKGCIAGEDRNVSKMLTQCKVSQKVTLLKKMNNK